MIKPQSLSRMNNYTLLPRPVLLAGVLCLSATAVTSRGQDFDEPDRSGWFIRADAVARFNMKASMKQLGPQPNSPRIYDDGFVLPDVSDTASGRTWNWGYQFPGQIRYDATGQPQAMVFSRLENYPLVSGEVNLGNPLLEGELIGGYHSDDFLIGKHKARIGFEIGYGYFSSSETMNLQADGNAVRTVDTYGLHGVMPPLAPYAGTFHGPGPLIDLYPNRQVEVFASPSIFQSSLEATFHNFRVGPSFGIDLTRRFNIQVGAGYDSLYAHVDWNYTESAAYAPGVRSVQLKEGNWRAGFYAEILAQYQLTSHLQLLLGGDFQYNSNLTLNDGFHEFTLELGSTYGAKGGLSYSF